MSDKPVIMYYVDFSVLYSDAEKILTKELSDKKKQAELIDDILQQSSLN